MRKVLVAGIGNIFLGDDAFGVEVAQRLARRRVPAGVDVVDFGIRGIDLAYALLDGYDAAVLVDALARGGEPGTVYVFEPAPPEGPAEGEAMTPSAHALDPAEVLRIVGTENRRCRSILLVGCEPESFGGDEGRMGLSEPVAAAVDRAIAIIDSLVDQLKLDDGQAQDLVASLPASDRAAPRDSAHPSGLADMP